MDKIKVSGELVGNVRTVDKIDFDKYGLGEEYLNRPNMKIIEADLHLIDEPCTPMALGGLSEVGESFSLTESATRQALSSLKGTPVHIKEKDLNGHFAKDPVSGDVIYKSIGTYLGGRIVDEGADKRCRVLAALWDQDFPKDVAQISSEKNRLGMSYEVIPSNFKLNEESGVVEIDSFTYKGGAILYKDDAAFPQTQLLVASKGGEKKTATVEISGCLFNGEVELDLPELQGTRWTRAFVNDLPDSSFALIKRPVEIKAEHRSLPYKNKNGKVDLPHLRSALARIEKVKGFSVEEITGAKKILHRAAKAHGIKTENKQKPKGGIHAMNYPLFCTECQDKVPSFIEAQRKELTEPIITDKDSIIATKDQAVKDLNIKVEGLETELAAVKKEKENMLVAQKESEATVKAEAKYEEVKANYPEDKKDELVAAFKRGYLGAPTMDDMELVASGKVAGKEEGKPEDSTLLAGAGSSVAGKPFEMTPELRKKIIKEDGINVKE